jgi:hypothetical protein
MFRPQLLAIFKELASFFDVCSLGVNLRSCDSISCYLVSMLWMITLYILQQVGGKYYVCVCYTNILRY